MVSCPQLLGKHCLEKHVDDLVALLLAKWHKKGLDYENKMVS